VPSKKSEYELVFNELFDTNIKWSNLRLEDLIQLAVLFDNPELFVKKLGISGEIHKEESKRQKGFLLEMADELMDTWPGPVAKALRKFVDDKDNQ